MTLTLAESLLYSTVKLIGMREKALFKTGTGFFWRLVTGDGRFADLIATNKHVIAGCDRLKTICHTSNLNDLNHATGVLTSWNMEIDPAGVFMHPDPAVDLCLLGVSPLLEKTVEAGTPLFRKCLSRDIIPTQREWSEFDAIEDVLMIGYPNGISDSANNLPIARRGITATSMGRNYESRSEFMVDMACFPGSSGSPVFVNQIGYENRATGQYEFGKRRFFFVGILYAGPMISNSGQIVLGGLPTVEVASMMHLGQIIRASEILVIEDIVRSRLS